MFRAFWIAGLFSNLGSWIHLVAAAWLMTSLTTSAAPVALLLTAASVPTFLLALPAGALADVVDRRRLIVVTQTMQALVAAVLAGLALAGSAKPSWLLLLTLLLSVGASLGSPVLLAVTPELVDRASLSPAVALNSTSFTLSQAVGPALGGLLVAFVGPGAAFAFNACSFLGVVVVALAWRRPRPLAQLPAEHVLGAMRAGIRYVRHAPALGVVLARTASYGLCFTVVPALLAVVSRDQLGADAAQYGLLLGSLGVGGLAGSLLLPRLRERFDHEHLVMLALGLYALVLLALSQLHILAAAFPVLAIAGFAGMTTMSTLNIAAQGVLPNWVRGRGLAIYQLVFAVAMAAGAAGWGYLAGKFGLRTTLVAAAVGMLANIVLARRLRLSVADAVDTGPLHSETPYVDLRIDPDDGPVFVTVEYLLPEGDLTAFRGAMRAVRRIRERDGAMHWGIFQSLSDPGTHIESYLLSSWAEYERLAGRGIASDGPILARVEELHTGDEPPRRSRFLGHHFHLFPSTQDKTQGERQPR
ncbi:MFS transporter [Flindersiella endophytica]